ncbi:TRAP transporter permease [Algihabitans albus]|uniref:TRAP transporter permease n=1 Tax=Algihabitans albus TaxID=2164067 RepID=UPI0013C34A70|nr:TRAP transporter fused permease subunit [Algihabitans albus]
MRDLIARGSAGLTAGLSLILSGLAVHAAGFGVFDTTLYSGLTVGLGLSILLLSQPGGIRRLSFHGGLAVGFAGMIWLWVSIMHAQETFFIDISDGELALAWGALALIFYATYRGFGWPMLLVCLALAVYVLAPFGADERWSRVAENLWYSTDGVFGRPVEVVGRVVLVFIVFGAVLQTSGAGRVLLKMALAATARVTGGPAHAAIVASGAFGTLSGSPIANVVSTGVFTIPIIKRAGFRPTFAGAVEAAASTGGQIMPPVMGVVAFLMADVTGIPYLQIVIAALIPALFYYLSLFAMVLIEARKQGLAPRPAPEVESVTSRDWLQSLSFFLPLGMIVFVLLQGRTAQYAGFTALIAATLLCLLLFPAFRHPKAWISALIAAGHTAATLMVIVAAIGFVIGVINMSGVGLQFAQAILSVSGTSLFLALLLVMLGSLVMGMGVPSAPAYLIVAIVMGPALEQLGLPTIAAHLFMLYFAVLSVVTPPVALAAFAAAPIAGARPMATGLEAFRLALAGFVIPFLFVWHPDILLIEGVSPLGLAWAFAIFGCSTWMVATALPRFDLRRLSRGESGLRLLAGLLALVPYLPVSLAGLALSAALIAFHRRSAFKIKTAKIEMGGKT